jgi:hypothetical protein
MQWMLLRCVAQSSYSAFDRERGIPVGTPYYRAHAGKIAFVIVKGKVRIPI